MSQSRKTVNDIAMSETLAKANYSSEEKAASTAAKKAKQDAEKEILLQVMRDNIEKWRPEYILLKSILIESQLSLDTICSFIAKCESFQVALAEIYLAIKGREGDIIDIIVINNMLDAVVGIMPEKIRMPVNRINEWSFLLYELEGSLQDRTGATHVQEFLGSIHRALVTFLGKFTNFEILASNKIIRNNTIDLFQENFLINEILQQFSSSVKAFIRPEKKSSPDTGRFEELSDKMFKLARKLIKYDSSYEQDADVIQLTSGVHSAENYEELERCYNNLEQKVRIVSEMQAMSIQIMNLKERAKSLRSSEVAALFDINADITAFPEKVLLGNSAQAAELLTRFKKLKLINDVRIFSRAEKSFASIELKELEKKIDANNAGDMNFIKKNFGEIVNEIQVEKELLLGATQEVSEADYISWLEKRTVKINGLVEPLKKLQVKLGIMPSSPSYIDKITFQNYKEAMCLLKKYAKIRSSLPHREPSAGLASVSLPGLELGPLSANPRSKSVSPVAAAPIKANDVAASSLSVSNGSSLSVLDDGEAKGDLISTVFDGRETKEDFVPTTSHNPATFFSNKTNNVSEPKVIPKSRNVLEMEIDWLESCMQKLKEVSSNDRSSLIKGYEDSVQNFRAAYKDIVAEDEEKELSHQTRQKQGSEKHLADLKENLDMLLIEQREQSNSAELNFDEKISEVKEKIAKYTESLEKFNQSIQGNQQKVEEKNTLMPKSILHLQMMMEDFYQSLATEFKNAVISYVKTKYKGSQKKVTMKDAVPDYIAQLNGRNFGNVKFERTLGVMISRVIFSYEKLRYDNATLQPLKRGLDQEGLHDKNNVPLLSNGGMNNTKTMK